MRPAVVVASAVAIATTSSGVRAARACRGGCLAATLRVPKVAGPNPTIYAVGACGLATDDLPEFTASVDGRPVATRIERRVIDGDAFLAITLLVDHGDVVIDQRGLTHHIAIGPVAVPTLVVRPRPRRATPVLITAGDDVAYWATSCRVDWFPEGGYPGPRCWRPTVLALRGNGDVVRFEVGAAPPLPPGAATVPVGGVPAAFTRAAWTPARSRAAARSRGWTSAIAVAGLALLVAARGRRRVRAAI